MNQIEPLIFARNLTLSCHDVITSINLQMRAATKTPSEWLRLLCRDWSQENEAIVAAADSRFLHYKPFLKGQLTSQLLCRLSISGTEQPAPKHELNDPTAVPPIDFWKILGVEDDFDRNHIVANIERFCSLYNIRGGTGDDAVPTSELMPNHFSFAQQLNFPDQMQMSVDHAGTAAAALLYPMDLNAPIGRNARMSQIAVKTQQRRIKAEIREREREAYSHRKAAEKAARAATREESRQRKLAMRKQREDFVQKQKEAALQRAADLVQSNRVPIEITRGAAQAQAAADKVVASAPLPAAEAAEAESECLTEPASTSEDTTTKQESSSEELPAKKNRSSIVISTASDLDQIVTHSNNLWAKYNAIAKEHNKRVNWITVAKELGIHVKVREKYARMHSRAKTRRFDFVNCGHYRIKDHPEVFLDPLLEEEGKSKASKSPNAAEAYVAQINTQQANTTTEQPSAVGENVTSLAAEAAKVVRGEQSKQQTNQHQEMQEIGAGVDVLAAVAEPKPSEFSDANTQREVAVEATLVFKSEDV